MPSAAPERPLRSDARLNRDRVLRAAEEVFRARGADAEIKEIADRAGVGVGTIYRHFPTKDKLMATIVEAMFDECRSALAEVESIEDASEAVRMLLLRSFRTVERYGDLVDNIHRQEPDAYAEARGDFDPVEAWAAVIRKGIASGQFRRDLDAELVASMLLSTQRVTVLHRLRPRRTIEQLADETTDLLLRSLRP